jgi:tellurite resistance protein
MQVHVLPRQAAHELKELSALITELWQDVTWRDVRSGKWFEKLLTHYVKFWEAQRATRVSSASSEPERAAAARRLIDKSALKAALAGAGCAGIVTAASVSTAETGGAAAPVVLPTAAASMIAELIVRSLLHLDLCCELAALNGVRFPPGQEAELVRLYALAVGAEMHETEDDPGRGLVERVVRLQQTGDLGKLVASRVVGEALLRNVLPFADVFVSSLSNYRLTREVGQFMEQYAQRRLRLTAAVAALRERSPDAVDLLLEGIWFVFISDGRLTPVETALLAHLLQGQASEQLTPRFISDQASWFERVRAAQLDGETHRLLWEGLAAASAADGKTTPQEGAILQHLADALGLKNELSQSTAA